MLDGFGSRELDNDRRVAALQIPKIMEIAVRENDETDILRLRVAARLLLAVERVFVFGLCFEHHVRKAISVEQEKINVAVFSLLKIVSECVNVSLGELDVEL